MSKNQKKIIIVSSLILLFIFVFSYSNFTNKDPSVFQTPPLGRGGINTEIVARPLSEEKFVLLDVLGQDYKVAIKEGDTVYNVMNNLQNQKEKNFTFKYKEYPSLGIFVDEINGVKGSPGKYWIYYVNDKEASVGVSKNISKEGD